MSLLSYLHVQIYYNDIWPAPDQMNHHKITRLWAQQGLPGQADLVVKQTGQEC